MQGVGWVQTMPERRSPRQVAFSVLSLPAWETEATKTACVRTAARPSEIL
jgi:hypothetical protein